MPGITEDTVLVEQTQELDNAIIPTLSADNNPLIGETQLHHKQDRYTDIHVTETCDIATELKAFKEFQASVEK